MGNGNLPATKAATPPAAILGRQKVGVNVRPEALGLRIPNLDICHKVETKEQVQAGWVPGYYAYAKNTVIEKPLVVFLKIDEARKYEAKDPATQKVRTLCASGDGVYPLPQIAHPPAKACAECPYGQWENSKTDFDPRTGKAKRVPPDCDEGYTFLGILPEHHGAPFWFRCFGTLRDNARDFARRFSTDPEAEAIYQWVVRLTTERPAKMGGFSWFLPVFTVERVIARADYEPLAQRAHGLLWSPPLARGGRVDDEGGDQTPPPPADAQSPSAAGSFSSRVMGSAPTPGRTPLDDDPSWPDDDDFVR